MTKRQLIEENLGDLVRAGLTFAQAGKMQRIARGLHRLAEIDCNQGLTPRQEARDDRLSNEAAEIAAVAGLASYDQGDPRGWPLYIYSPADSRIKAFQADHPTWEKGEVIGSMYSSIGVAVCPF